MECDRCTDTPTVIYADTFCVECEHVPICAGCFATHVHEIIDDLERDREARERRNR